MRLPPIPVTLLSSLVLGLLCPGLVAQAEQEKKPPEAESAQARAARYKAKGFVEIEGVWVAKDKVADAKNGVFHHDGTVVNHLELEKLQSGFVRHPVTGMFIAAADRKKAEDQFPLDGDEWGDKAAANKYHASFEHPWFIRSNHCNIVSTLPLDTILSQVAREADSACNRLMPVFGGGTPPPNRRPTILVLPTVKDYIAFGENHGDGGSAHGAFLTPEYRIRCNGSRVRVGAAHWDKNWGPYYVRHAAGLALCHAFCGDASDDVPEWFHRAVGGYVERLFRPDLAKYFGAKFAAAGGVKDVKGWLAGFKVSADSNLSADLFEAGLILSFAMHGGNKEVTAAMQKVTEAFVKGGKVVPAVQALGKAVGKNEADLAAYLQKIIQ